MEHSGTTRKTGTRGRPARRWAEGGAVIGPAAETRTITDDDAPPTLSIDSPSVTEETGATGGTLAFTVSLSAASGRDVTAG